MEWNGMEWNGMEWNGMEWNGIRRGREERDAAAKMPSSTGELAREPGVLSNSSAT
jgi:hypothetical protein